MFQPTAHMKLHGGHVFGLIWTRWENFIKASIDASHQILIHLGKQFQIWSQHKQMMQDNRMVPMCRPNLKQGTQQHSSRHKIIHLGQKWLHSLSKLLEISCWHFLYHICWIWHIFLIYLELFRTLINLCSNDWWSKQVMSLCSLKIYHYNG